MEKRPEERPTLERHGPAKLSFGSPPRSRDMGRGIDETYCTLRSDGASRRANPGGPHGGG